MESLEGGGAGGGGGSLGRGLQRDSGEGGRQQEAEPSHRGLGTYVTQFNPFAVHSLRKY